MGESGGHRRLRGRGRVEVGREVSTGGVTGVMMLWELTLPNIREKILVKAKPIVNRGMEGRVGREG